MERILDLTPTNNGEYRPFSHYTEFFNGPFSGKGSVSASDVYWTPNSRLSHFREYFNKKEYFVTNTRIIYRNLLPLLQTFLPLKAKIIHNFGSTVVQPTEKSLVVPVYRNVSVEEVVKGGASKDGLKYLQALFDTEDEASTLIGRLEEISKKEAKDIRIFTADQDSRRENNMPHFAAERTVGFYNFRNILHGDVLYIYCDGWFFNG